MGPSWTGSVGLGSSGCAPGHSLLLRVIVPVCVCVQDYISEFQFKSVVAQDLIDFFLGYFPELRDAAVAQREGEHKDSSEVCSGQRLHCWKELAAPLSIRTNTAV